MLKKIQMNDIFKNIFESDNVELFDLSVPYNIFQSDGNVITTGVNFSGEEVLYILINDYSEFAFIYDNKVFTDSMESFYMAWDLYKAEELKNLSAMYSAYESEYNPLENYNGNETVTESFTDYQDEKEISGTVRTNARVKGYSANAGDIQVSDTEGGYTTSVDINDGNNTPDWRAKTTHSETAYNTTELKDVAQDIASPSVSTTMTQADSENNFTTWDNYKETNTKTGSKTNSLTRHGNLGVTTSQSMVQSELELRTHDLLEDWLSTFAKKYLILSPDVHEEDSEWGGLF